MTHTTFHVLRDKHNKYIDTLQDAKKAAQQWKSQGDSQIRIFKITTKEIGNDEILLNEEAITESN